MQAVAVDAGDLVAVGGHGVGVPGQHQPLRPTEVGAGHQVVAHPVDRQPGHRRQLGLEPVDEGALGAAHRRDGHQVGGQGEEVGARAAGRS